MALVLVCPRNIPVWCFSVKKWQHGFEPTKDTGIAYRLTFSPDAVIAFLSSCECEQTACQCSTNARVVTLPKAGPAFSGSAFSAPPYISAVQSWNWGKRSNMLKYCPLCHPLFIPPLPSLPLFSVPLPPFLCAPFLYRVENATNTHFLRLFSATASSSHLLLNML